ncbi:MULTISPECIES: inorganic phosphate transporter [Helicobacter]|uniref:inorganic phosphate transporter n=1 Tax=Helicobacter TaxID=209 RepID=UPI0026084ED5|nr:inorganic phosphate transporter [Helicobacter sp. UBA3407]
MESFLQPDKGFKINKEGLQKVSIIFVFVLAIIVMVAFAESVTNPILLGFAAIVGGYMALNIGANDVANNMGPAVGSKALTMTGAIIIAAICEILGALIAGGEVVGTVSKGIISADAIGDSSQFVTLMLAALISGAIWLNIATVIGAPVSTTHAIVGGILGAGIAAGGFGVANWTALGKIASSWVISPIMGGVIAAILLFFIKHTITYKKNKKTSAENIVPYLIAFMTWAFSLYLINKGLKHVIQLEPQIAFGISIFIAIVVYFVVKPIIKKALEGLENKKEEINKLFTLPLIFAVALLSFAHGANDVANAVGPLAAINSALKVAFDASQISVPFWIMLIGGLGISIGLALFGPRLIRTVGSEITELDQMRAYCIAMSAALTVLVASELGMPVSSTHIAIGAVFGIGFLREHLKRQYKEMELKILESRKGEDNEKVKEFLDKFRNASIRRKRAILKSIDHKKTKGMQKNIDIPELKKKEQKRLKEAYQEELVKRSAINKIIAAWVITVPASAIFSAVCYFMLSAIGF